MFDSIRYRMSEWLRPKAMCSGPCGGPERAYIPPVLHDPKKPSYDHSRVWIQAQAEYWAARSALLARMAKLWEQYTVGTGLVLQPASSSPEFNIAAKAVWELWCKEPDVGSRQPFSILQSVISKAFFIYGECPIVLVYDDEGLPKIQILGSRQIKTPEGKVDSETLSDGVVLNKFGKPTGYYVDGREDPIPAASVVHIFTPSQVGQVRGLPFIQPVLSDLADLAEIQDLTKQCVKNDATLWSIIKTPTGELSPAQMRAAAMGIPPAAGSAAACARQDAGTYYQEVFGSTAKVIRSTDTWESFKSDRPSANALDFMRGLSEKVGIGGGFPLIMLLPSSVQGTVARGTYETAGDFFRSRSLVLQYAFADIFAFVIEGMKNRVPALRDPPADWRQVRMHPPRGVDVDPGRNAVAELASYAAGTTNLRSIYSGLSQDWITERRQWFAERKMDLELAEEFGVAPPAIGNSDPAPKAEPKPDDPEPEPKKEEEEVPA
jgi:hypothetical protein